MKSDLQPYIGIVRGIAAHFGINCEVALHDLRKPQASLVAIAGQLTNRALGAPITNYVLNLLQQHANNVEENYYYHSFTKDQRKVKASTTFLRNQDGQVIGCICINYCIDMLYAAQETLTSLTDFGPAPDDEDEHYGNDISDLVAHILESVLGRGGLILSQMDRSAKLRVVKELEQRGLFLVKGSVELVAARLGISKYTLYTYIDETKQEEQPEEKTLRG